MDEKPQPAPPIYQPEVAADAVLKAIDTDAREILVGRSVLQLLFGNMLFPDLVERQLTKMGVEAQQSGRPDLREGDNLDGPYLDYPTKAHGAYDDKAEDRGITVDGDRARKAAVFGGAALLLAVGGLLGRAATSGGSGSNRIAAQDHARVWSEQQRPPMFERPGADG